MPEVMSPTIGMNTGFVVSTTPATQQDAQRRRRPRTS
jgi:hypothetical protein